MNQFRLVLLTTILVLPLIVSAKPGDSMTETLLQNEVRLGSKESPVRSERITVLVDLIPGAGASGVRRDFIAQLIKSKLTNSGIGATKYSGSFQEDFVAQKLESRDLLAPKLVTEINIDPDDPRLGYSSDCGISLIEYAPVPGENGRFKAQKTWFKRQTLRGISRQDIEDNLVQYIQKELSSFVVMYRSTKEREIRRSRLEQSRKEVGQGERGGQNGSGALSYSLRWNDPDNKRNRFLIGASAGTPAYVNLHFGFWGSRSFPLVAGISGMYLGQDKRGAQVDLGWAFDNTGSFKQVFGVAAAVLSETDKVTSYERDEFGRVLTTTVETVNALRPYVGPTYTMDWNNFRVQVGVGARMSSQSQSNFRALFQIGYTPPLGF